MLVTRCDPPAEASHATDVELGRPTADSSPRQHRMILPATITSSHPADGILSIR